MLKLTPQADLGVFYDADSARYAAGCTQDYTQTVTRDAFAAFYAECPSIGFESDGAPIGGILFDGEQAHIAVLPRYHGLWALLLKPALQWLFSLKADILVAVENDNHRCLRFMERHGWQRIEARGDDIIYRITPQGGLRKTEYPRPHRNGAPAARAAGPAFFGASPCLHPQ
ncbi:GNAT family N-acetyltransferase [Acidovorax sp. SUPP2539]|uniref:GNAT family N-acetyltransferase n=1 Tax=Acidovorax sp. SUPP2539 TaxID=2920878 RepID=UPI0023DE299F|nr:GNAT family N-acetyltransferase [Acidovorax sp. SUPP2539]GKS91770.1 GNAT family N-acetyltransferase [Acidovorax sp. SUPP2539]